MHCNLETSYLLLLASEKLTSQRKHIAINITAKTLNRPHVSHRNFLQFLNFLFDFYCAKMKMEPSSLTSFTHLQKSQQFSASVFRYHS